MMICSIILANYIYERTEHYAKTVPIRGCITSSNAKPKHYESQVYFSSRVNFKLILIRDSIVLKNQCIEKEREIKLSPDLFKENGTVIGYSHILNGELPGGHEYSSFIVFSAKAVFDFNIYYTVETFVRKAGDSDKTWKDSVDAKIGDKVEFQIEYRNLSDATHNQVVVDADLPSNLRYVPGTTQLFNTIHPTGAKVKEDDIIATGVIIGNYEKNTNAFVRFTAEVVNDNFTCGKFILRTWGRATANHKVVQDSADVNVQLASCPDPENNIES